MNNDNKTDKFVATNITTKRNSDNFFLEGNSTLKINFPSVTIPTKRLNGYDSALFEEGAYKDVKDDTFKLEYKITKIEELITDFTAKLQAAKDIRDFEQAEVISEALKQLNSEHKTLVTQYNNRSLSAKISDSLFNLFGQKSHINTKRNVSGINDNSDKILSKLPKCLSSIVQIKESLTKLENINKSVDNLVSLNMPYGEDYNKYEQLSKYIIKANSIQAQISKQINKNK